MIICFLTDYCMIGHVSTFLISDHNLLQFFPGLMLTFICLKFLSGMSLVMINVYYTAWQTRYVIIWTLGSLQHFPLLFLEFQNALDVSSSLTPPRLRVAVFLYMELCPCPRWVPFKIESKFCHSEDSHVFSDFLGTSIESLYTSVKAFIILSPTWMWTCWFLSAS